MLAYPGSIRKLVENILKAVREIKKLSRLKKKCQKKSIFLLLGNFNRRKRAHSQQLKIYKLPRNNILLFSHQVMSDFCDPMDCSTPRFSVLYHLWIFAQIYVHRVDDAI